MNMIILAKGESTRMGKGKAFLRVGKERILDDMLRKLKGIKASDEEIILVPRYQNYFEPLHAIYSRSILPRIKENLDQSIFKIQSLFFQVRTRYIQEEELNLFGNWRSFFFNVNKEADLRKAREKHHRDDITNRLFHIAPGETVRMTEARI